MVVVGAVMEIAREMVVCCGGLYVGGSLGNDLESGSFEGMIWQALACIFFFGKV